MEIVGFLAIGFDVVVLVGLLVPRRFHNHDVPLKGATQKSEHKWSAYQIVTDSWCGRPLLGVVDDFEFSNLCVVGVVL